MAHQEKAPKGGRKLKRIPVYRNHYERNFHSVERNKARRIARFREMVAESVARRAKRGPYPGEQRRLDRYAAYCAMPRAVPK